MEIRTWRGLKKPMTSPNSQQEDQGASSTQDFEQCQARTLTCFLKQGPGAVLGLVKLDPKHFDPTASAKDSHLALICSRPPRIESPAPLHGRSFSQENHLFSAKRYGLHSISIESNPVDSLALHYPILLDLPTPSAKPRANSHKFF